jgi:LacI family transcriptional regulator
MTSGMSIRELARSLDLSITTVSRALAGYSDVSEATRARVLAQAGAIGYRPNAAARRLKMGRADAIGLVLPAGPSGFADPFLAELIGAVGMTLAERDLDLLVTAVPEGEVRALDRLITARKVDGIIVPRTRWNDARVDLLIERAFPFIAHGRSARAAEHAWLDVDGRAAFASIAERLFAAGHRRIAMINAPAHFAYARDREAGFVAALEARGLDQLQRPIVALPTATVAAAEVAASSLLAAPSVPTAIACATDPIAYGVLRALRAAGLRAGHDVAVIGYDDLPQSALVSPPLTTMRQPIREEGRRLVEMLLERIAGREASDLQELWPAELVERDSDRMPVPPGNQG